MNPLLKNLCRSAALCLTMSASLTPQFAAAQSGEPADGEQRGGRGGPPPQEAFDACASLQVNDSCSVETPNDTVNGTCQQAPRDEQLLCVPAR